ncbi:MAG: ATP-grasp domain-containing protein [Clostridiales bacterium]|nr:ATP-grasp domain-containing protein [Candidatus Crickella caballi]
MKKILILGAGIYQVPLIKAAQRLGIHTIVCSIPGEYPGFAIADQVYYENTVDSRAILKIARDEKVDGIVTAGTDVCVPTIGKVCDELNLRGLSAEAAEISSNKRLMKKAYEAEGVRSAKFREIATDDLNYAEKLEGLEFPLIFKAVDSSGSRGITRVDSEDEFEAARQCVLDNTRSGYYLIEEFIEGEEFGAQAFVQDGKLEFILPHGDYVFKGSTGVPVGHFAPYNIPDIQLEDCRETLTKAIRAMKLDNCAINADFILKDGKTYVLEIGGRSGATCLAELVAIYYDFDYYEKIIRVAMGEKVDFSSDKAIPNASKLLTSGKDGVIAAQYDDNADSNGAYIDPNIVDVQFDYRPGDSVHKFNIGPHRIGHVITKGSTLKEATAALETALNKIKIDVE